MKTVGMILMITNAVLSIYYYLNKDYSQACWFLLIIIIIDRGLK